MKCHAVAILYLALALAVTNLGTVFARSTACLPSTCDGPVLARFSNSNCTGDVVYQTLEYQFGVCNGGQYNEMDESGLYIYHFTGTLCDRTLANSSFEMTGYMWGACQSSIGQEETRGDPQLHGMVSRSELSSMSSGFMFLASVNDTYIAPQDFDDQPLPAFERTFSDCAAPNNCTLPNGLPAITWHTHYPMGNTCSDPDYSFMDINQKVGECQNYQHIAYVKSDCFSSKGYQLSYYLDSSCSHPIKFSQFQASCSTTDFESHCQLSAPVSPLVPSASSSISHSTLSTFLILISLLVVVIISW